VHSSAKWSSFKESPFLCHTPMFWELQIHETPSPFKYCNFNWERTVILHLWIQGLFRCMFEFDYFLGKCHFFPLNRVLIVIYKLFLKI